MLVEYLKERILPRLTATKPAQASPAADPAGELQHIEQVIQETEADLQEAKETVEHCRQQLAEVDTRTLLDRPDVDDDRDADDWQVHLAEAQEDFSRLSAALPKLVVQRDAAKLALKRHELATCLDRIEGSKRQYTELATVLMAQLSSAADTAAGMTDVSAAIETERSRAYDLQVEAGAVPSGISFTQVDLRALWVQALSKARTRPAATVSTPPPMVPAETPVGTVPEARSWYEEDGHRWELTPLPSPATCRHPVGNKSAGGGCGEPATLLGRYILPDGSIREWPYCVEHSRQYAAAHHLTTEG